MAAEAAKTKASYFPLGGSVQEDGNKATATCFCGAVQILFPTTPPGLVDTFICNCTDCRKITASTFASNFIVTASTTTHTRGKEKLTQFAQSRTIETGNVMTNYFCSVCGTLMYRVSSGFPDKLIPRIGTVDDFNLQEGVLRPRIEQYVKDRVGWFEGTVGSEKHLDGGHTRAKSLM